ncbi:myosin light chain kinase 2, skeletal/cardiac muscle [Synchiropus splendidus]|uniref:myosin light chain kinase 2, skeletal/cardiac muscle n=1 Tax=Synchiropus splendidus TaxID=270530 RepID=UPI00237DCC39|nr:myosin light chain kinase 2, skeletal/cardiac muscle [Synchiropus splendidus]
MTSLIMTAGVDQKDGGSAGFDLIHNRIESLSSKMDKLIHIQEKVLTRLDGMSQDIDDIENDMENLKVDHEEIHLPPRMVSQTQVVGKEVKKICQEMSNVMSAVNQRSEMQAEKLEGMEKLVLSMQQVISFIGETVKSSRVMELMFKGPASRKSSKPKDSKGKQAIKRRASGETVTKQLEKMRDHKNKDETGNANLSPKFHSAQKSKTPIPSELASSKKQALLLEEVHKLNQENTEKSSQQFRPASLDLEAGVSSEGQEEEQPGPDLDEHKQDSSASKDAEDELVEEDADEDVVKEAEAVTQEVTKEAQVKLEIQDDASTAEGQSRSSESPAAPEDQRGDTVSSAQDESDSSPVQAEQVSEVESFVTEEHYNIKAEEVEKREDEDEEKLESEGWAVFRADGVELEFDLKQKVERRRQEFDKSETLEDDDAERYFIDTTPPPTAPFNHRIVSAKPNQISNFYTINWQEVLGGGRFGQVHKCVENSSGLTLAAKVIKARGQKEKEVVKNEIQVMNNLDHANLIQLYAAYESRNDIILVLEYVGGGELFDRIIDENYTLMELDAVVFIRQICEGLQHMHKMYILHLDLKPENILCVSRVTNKIKIIDFGLARIYKPREKLRVNFGTPEFLAPEVINYDFVSFNTDMWSLGVITYMLLSGLSPFLGDDDNQTLNNILACQWNFNEPEFMDTSEEAKDFISRLLLVNRNWRIGASEALRHPWLSDPTLHHRLHTKKTMCRSRRSSCVPTADS